MLTRLIRSLMISLALLLPCIAAADTAPMFLGVVGDTQKPDGDPLADFRWGLSQVSELPLDALLMPGDLTDTGTHVQWKGFMAALEGFPHPVVYAAGNHDAVPGPRLYRSLFRRYTGQPARAHYRIGEWRLLVLDTPRFHGRRLEHNGTVGEVQLRWIERQLAQIGTEEPIMVMAHHPFGEPSDGIENWEEVLAAFEGRRRAALDLPGRPHCGYVRDGNALSGRNRSVGHLRGATGRCGKRVRRARWRPSGDPLGAALGHAHAVGDDRAALDDALGKLPVGGRHGEGR